jgi:hypothetical protein
MGVEDTGVEYWQREQVGDVGEEFEEEGGTVVA